MVDGNDFSLCLNNTVIDWNGYYLFAWLTLFRFFMNITVVDGNDFFTKAQCYSC